jgi:hypothetical protein
MIPGDTLDGMRDKLHRQGLVSAPLRLEDGPRIVRTWL